MIELLEQRRLLATVPAGFVDETVAAGLHAPTAMTLAPDGRVFVAEQGGDLRIIKDGQLLDDPFLSVNVDDRGERGLLGVALDPDFAANGFVYIYYTATTPNVHNRVSRFTAAGDVAASGGELVLLELEPLSAAQNHNGGAIHFGIDGKLYVAVGENAAPAHSQTLENRLGKMLRINPDGSIPADNPFLKIATGDNRAIWAMGLRNPFTFAVQPGTGRIFINDVGQSSFEEINEGIAGANYGWPATEGPTTNPAFVSPVYSYGRSEGTAITGGTFYNPAIAAFPSELVGQYFFSDLTGGYIRYFDPDSPAIASPFATGLAVPVDLDTADDGSLYYLERGFGAATGRVGRIRAKVDSPPVITDPPESKTVSEGAPLTLQVTAGGAGTLSYQWQKDGDDLEGQTGPSLTIPEVTSADAGAYRVRVNSEFGTVFSDVAVVSVTPNQPPAPIILAPRANLLYRAGARYLFAGVARDAEDRILRPTSFTWRIDFHHADHVHPFMPEATGRRAGTFVIPNVGETATDVFYRIILTATDSVGASTTVTRDFHPRVVHVAVTSNVAGAGFTLDGQPQPSLLAFQSVAGMRRDLGVLEPEDTDEQMFTFIRWAGGPRAATFIVAPVTHRVFRMLFRATPAQPSNG